MHVDIKYDTDSEDALQVVPREGEDDTSKWLMCDEGAKVHGLSPEGSLRVSSESFSGSLPVYINNITTYGGGSKYAHGVVVGDRLMTSSCCFEAMVEAVCQVLGLSDEKGLVHRDLTVHVGQTPEGA